MQFAAHEESLIKIGQVNLLNEIADRERTLPASASHIDAGFREHAFRFFERIRFVLGVEDSSRYSNALRFTVNDAIFVVPQNPQPSSLYH
jgi:hypothetical protein